jgi:hypothetical protein
MFSVRYELNFYVRISSGLIMRIRQPMREAAIVFVVSVYPPAYNRATPNGQVFLNFLFRKFTNIYIHVLLIG